MPTPSPTAKKAPVTALIVAWNSEPYLGACLKSVREQTRPPVQLVVVDNASTDRSVQIAADAGAALIRNEQNLGFAPAVNQGWAQCTEPWLFLVNPDLVLERDYLERVLATLEANPRAGMGQGKLLRMTPGGEQTAIIDSAGIIRRRFGAFFVDRGAGDPDHGQYDRPGSIFGPCAAAALYRREMLEQLAPDGAVMDEDFFAYVEDVDLAWRGRAAGWEALYEPSAVGWHVRGGSELASPRQQQLLYRNRLWTLAKNASAAELLRMSPGWLAYEAAKLAQGVLTKPFLREVWAERFGRWSEMRRRGKRIRDAALRPTE